MHQDDLKTDLHIKERWCLPETAASLEDGCFMRSLDNNGGSSFTEAQTVAQNSK